MFISIRFRHTAEEVREFSKKLPPMEFYLYCKSFEVVLVKKWIKQNIVGKSEEEWKDFCRDFMNS